MVLFSEVINLSQSTKGPISQSFFVIFLQIAGLSALAVGQPLLQLVQKNPEFLVVHNARTWDVIILTMALLFLPPLVLSGLVLLGGMIRQQTGAFIHFLILGGLLTLVLLPLVDKIPAVNGWVTLMLAVFPAAVLIFRFGRHRALIQNLGFLAIALPAVLILFLSSTPIKNILFPDVTPALASAQKISNPVVMIIFDEFPLSSLLGMDHELDCQLFPNFCRLAESSTWYRNATSISGATLRAVPAIMTGKFPRWSAAPTLAEHPQNIFTLLGSSHQIFSLETQTSLCPDELRSEPVPVLSRRMGLLFEDILILYQHIVVPDKWLGSLTPVADKWGDFKGIEKSTIGESFQVTRIEKFENFVNSLEEGEKPNLSVVHILLPHVPFQFLPDGKIYNWRKKAPVQDDGSWGPDKVLVAHSYRGHLLQAVAVDRLIGTLLDRLEELGLFEEAAIVVTADHGACFRTGLSRRQFNVGNEADIMRVPLFIKVPGQDSGVISDFHAQTVDIMPTLVSALGCRIDWNFDGVDLLSESTTDRTELDFMNQDTYEELKVSLKKMEGMDEVIQMKTDLFGEDGGCERLFTMSDPGNHVGKAVVEFQVENHSVLRGRILDEFNLEEVDLNSRFVPAEINGTIAGHDGKGRLLLALALNGKISGFSETYLDGPEPGIFNWQITVSPDAFINGLNKVELFQVEDSPSGMKLHRIPLTTPSFLGTDMGGVRVSGIQENGLLNTHDWDGRWVRWTNGDASWKIPLKEGEKPRMLTLKIVSSGPLASDVSITVNGTRVLSQVLPNGSWETRLPLGSVSFENSLTVELESSVFIPAENNPESSDQRILGLAVATLIVD